MSVGLLSVRLSAVCVSRYVGLSVRPFSILFYLFSIFFHLFNVYYYFIFWLAIFGRSRTGRGHMLNLSQTVLQYLILYLTATNIPLFASMLDILLVC